VTTVIPFRAGGKTRLPDALRRELAPAMLGDVVEAALGLGEVVVVTSDGTGAVVARELGADAVKDPGGGQGAAVRAGLDRVVGACLVVNADLPCATTDAIRRLAGFDAALVAAEDGTTNALRLPRPECFVDLYGPGSATRFAATGLVPVCIPELERDIDAHEDLARLLVPAGRRTTLVLNRHKALTPTAG
jgi:2-phospho-L-lactate guanylyltransferase